MVSSRTGPVSSPHHNVVVNLIAVFMWVIYFNYNTIMSALKYSNLHLPINDMDFVHFCKGTIDPNFAVGRNNESDTEAVTLCWKDW